MLIWSYKSYMFVLFILCERQNQGEAYKSDCQVPYDVTLIEE